MAQKLGLALSLPTIKTAAGSAFENLYALDFDGSNDFVDFGSGSTFTPNSSGANRGFSISYWAKTSFSRFVTMNKQDNSPAKEWQAKIDTSGTVVFEVFGNNDGGIKQSLTTDTSAGSFINVSDGNWHHIVMTFDLTSGSSSLLIYIDGVLFSDANGGATYASAGTWAAVINTSAPFRLAADSRGFKGVMDEVSMFDAVLTVTNVNDIYNSGKPGDLTGFGFLIGWWRNGDPTGTGAFPTIVDQSTNSNDGTMTNMISADIVTDVP
jgi:hypothetical protein